MDNLYIIWVHDPNTHLSLAIMRLWKFCGWEVLILVSAVCVVLLWIRLVADVRDVIHTLGYEKAVRTLVSIWNLLIDAQNLQRPYRLLMSMYNKMSMRPMNQTSWMNITLHDYSLDMTRRYVPIHANAEASLQVCTYIYSFTHYL